ncbi:MAG: hypothetical protein JNK82_29525 [Myxococcaceae bacterium]|nr:hypothetical protein [Myxococcaceae bacterium]
MDRSFRRLPVLTAVAPPQAVVGYSTLMVDGTSLGGSITVGGVAQLKTTDTATQIVTAPLQPTTPPGTQPVVVTTTAGASNALNVTVLAPFRISSVTAPSSTTVEVTFNRPPAAATVTPARFTIAGLTVLAATASGAVVTLRTGFQSGGRTYTLVPSSALTDLLGAPLETSPQPTFTGFGAPLPTEFVLSITGDGSALTTSVSWPIKLERRSLSAPAVVTATVQLPTSAPEPITVVGANAYEGAISRSTDGTRLVVTGYQQDANVSTSTAATWVRVVAIIDAADFSNAAGIDQSRKLGTLSGASVRSTVLNGTDLWLGTNVSGVLATSTGAGSMLTAVTPGYNVRRVGIVDGQLYATTTGNPGDGLFAIGAGLPMSSGALPTLVFANPTSTGFALFDVDPNEPGPDLLYVTDDGTALPNGLKRVVKSAGNWSVAAVFSPPVNQLACYRDDVDVVCVACAGLTCHLFRDVSTSTPSGALPASFQTFSTTAPNNFRFRGVALAPTP